MAILLDSDDKLYPNHLEVANNLLLSNAELVIFHLAYEEIDKDGNIIRKNINLSSTSLIKGNTYGCHGMFLKKSFFQQFYFNEDRTIAGLEDWELWLRISAQYPIPHFPIITSALIQHDQRSVLLTKKESLINRVNAFMNYVLNNQDIVHTYKNKLQLFRCSCYTYISLHLALTGKYKSTSFYYLLKGIIENPFFIFQKTFFCYYKTYYTHMVKLKKILVLTYWDFNDALIQTYTLPYLYIISKYIPENSTIYLLTLNKNTTDNINFTHPQIKVLQFKYIPFGLKAIFYYSYLLIYLFIFILTQEITHIHACAHLRDYLVIFIHSYPKTMIIDSYEPHAEAMVEVGEWKKNSLPFRLLFYFEKKMTHHAKYLLQLLKKCYRICGKYDIVSILIKTTGLLNPPVSI